MDIVYNDYPDVRKDIDSVPLNNPLTNTFFRYANKIFNEKDYGLCLESFDGKDYWVFSLVGHPINEKTGEFSFDIPLDISNLRRNVKYSVYPYSRVSNFLLRGEEKMVCRKGVSFTISDDGQLSTATIDDIPGTQL